PHSSGGPIEARYSTMRSPRITRSPPHSSGGPIEAYSQRGDDCASAGLSPPHSSGGPIEALVMGMGSSSLSTSPPHSSGGPIEARLQSVGGERSVRVSTAFQRWPN